MYHRWKSLSGENEGDQIQINPGVAKASNESSGDSVETIPTQITITNPDNTVQTLKAISIRIEDASGNYIEQSLENGFVHQNGTRKVQLSADGGLVITQDGKTTTLDLLSLLHDDGAGKTNSVTEEQMVISDSGKTAVFETTSVTLTNDADSISIDTTDGLQASISGKTLSVAPTGIELTSGADSVQLDFDHLLITQDSDSVEVQTSGISATNGGYDANLTTGSGVHLSGPGGGTVDIATVEGQTLSVQETAMCSTDDSGSPAPATSYLVRAEITLT